MVSILENCANFSNSKGFFVQEAIIHKNKKANIFLMLLFLISTLNTTFYYNFGYKWLKALRSA
jgi:hypothetical protein